MKVDAERPETEDAQDIWRQNRNPGLKWWCVLMPCPYLRLAWYTDCPAVPLFESSSHTLVGGIAGNAALWMSSRRNNAETLTLTK